MILRCPVDARAGTGEEATAGREGDGMAFVIPDFPFEILAQTESEGLNCLNSARTEKSFGKK